VGAFRLRTPLQSKKLQVPLRCVEFSPFEEFLGEEPLNTGGSRIFCLDVSFGLLATASASAPALFLGSALCWCGVSCML